MHINLTARHFRAPKILKDLVFKKILKLEKFYEGIVSCDVILTNEKNSQNLKKVEINIKVYRSMLTSVVWADDFSKAVASAVAKLERQLKRYKSKMRERYKLQKRHTALAA